jgi:hypothetical protein
MVGVAEMEVGVIAWMVSRVSEEVPNAANGAEAEVERSADQARVSKSIICGTEENGAGEAMLRRPALPLNDRDRRLSPDGEGFYEVAIMEIEGGSEGGVDRKIDLAGVTGREPDTLEFAVLEANEGVQSAPPSWAHARLVMSFLGASPRELSW